MLHLVIDAREAFAKQKAGKGVYCLSVITALANKYAKGKVTLLISKNPHKVIVPKNWELKVIPGNGLKWQFNAAKYISKERKVMLFSPTSYLLPLLVNCKRVVTVHDLITFLHPGGHNLKALIIERFCLPRLINKVDFIAVSESTKNDLIRLFPKLAAKSVTVCQNALPLIAHTQNTNKKLKIKKNPKMLLTVSTLIPRKNLSLLLQAFDELVAQNKEFSDLQLHVVGAKAWRNSKMANTIKNLKNQKNIKFHGYISNQKLQDLYQAASIFVYPSLYEGFGLPILEALSKNCSVIASDTSSIPEAGGDAAIYFDPHSKSDLVSQLGYLLRNKELQQVLVENGKDQLKRFSWEDTVNTLIKLLN